MNNLEIILLFIFTIILVVIIIYGLFELVRKLLKKEPFWPTLKNSILDTIERVINALF